ncbi:MAG: hypothetical protein ACYDH2_07220 [Anaerolineaceae bacterium]
MFKIENKFKQPDAETLLYFSYHLGKPISYFYPAPYKPDIQTGELSEKEQELLIQARSLSDDGLKRIIAQVKAIVNINQ